MNDDHNTAEADVQTLIAQLRSPNAGSRLHAAEELGRLGDARAVQPLLQALCGVRDVALRTAGIQALGKIGTPATDHLKQVLSDRQRWGLADLRTEAASLLGILGKADAVPTLAAALSDPVQSVVARAAWSLGMIGTPDAKEHLPVLLRHSDPMRRLCAADVLAKFGDAPVIIDLIETLDDSDEGCRFAAARALGHIAQRCPSLALRAAIPQLQRLQRCSTLSTMRAAFEEAITCITDATDAVHDLPQPASAPHMSAEILPVPASAPLLLPETLPLPANAPDDAINSISHHPTLLEKLRHVLRRSRQERSS